ncbi:hypothetical protein Fot_21794 [Forsythia ovata]|uniref:Uncharacterized protein n=1 Tax=Forsythia ovata TaxID=205694 RepID=A0ABD1UWW8_9LAMI
MKKQGSSTLPKIWLASLAAKKIPPVMKEKSSNHDHKMTLTSLSLKGGEKDQDTTLVPTDSRQTVLVSIALSQGLQLTLQKQEVGAKRAEKKRAKEAALEERGLQNCPQGTRKSWKMQRLPRRPRNHGLPPPDLLRIWLSVAMRARRLTRWQSHRT